MTERTDASTHRDAVNDILNARTDVRNAADVVVAALDKAERVLIRTASLDAEYFNTHEPTHAAAPSTPRVSLPHVAERANDAERIAAKSAADAELSMIADLTERAEHAEHAAKTAASDLAAALAANSDDHDIDISECVICQSFASLGLVAPTPHKAVPATTSAADALRKRANDMRSGATTHAALSPNHAAAASFASVGATPPPPRVALPTLRLPASVPFTGVDATNAVYDAILASVRKDTSMANVDARHNAHVVVGNPRGLIQIAVTLANVTTIPAGKAGEPWGQFLTTTVRPNPSKNARRANITYAPLTDSLDYAMYLAVPESVSQTVTPFPMPNAPHLMPNVNAAALGARVDAADNWRLHVDGGKLIVTFALPTYANIVTAKRSPSWGCCVATTRHAGSRRIAKTVTLGKGLIFMLDVVQRVKAR